MLEAKASRPSSNLLLLTILASACLHIGTARSDFGGRHNHCSFSLGIKPFLAMTSLASTITLLLSCSAALAHPSLGRSSDPNSRLEFTWPPTVKSVEILGNATDDTINRDSCGTTRVFDRVLWVCRDTQPNVAPGHSQLYPVYSSSASWANFHFDGTPSTTLYGGDHAYTAYYPYAADECPPDGPMVSQCPTTGACPGPLNLEGLCSDRKKRYALWPDSPPLVSSEGGLPGVEITAYTWIKKTFIGLDLTTYVDDPATSLYKVTYNHLTRDPNTLPEAQLIDEEFWQQDAFPYGAYGNIVKNGVAYLLAQTSTRLVALARVPAHLMDRQSDYEFYVNGSEMPGINDTGANIPNISAGGQGTYFFSYFWNKFVWIGQASPSVMADFYITVADKMEGPWEEPYHFYSGINGDYFLSAYSLLAHPALSPGGKVVSNEVYISYTKNDVGFGTNIYTQPLIKVTWGSG
jgi:hypothetical protein